MAEHALLSPSSAARWLQCTPSALLESEALDLGSSYADEGTLAHSLAELELKLAFGQIQSGLPYETKLKAIKAHKLYSREMENHVADYVLFVEEAFNALGPDAKIYFEVRLNLSAWVPESFGTGDVVIVADGVAHLIDLKYGKGVPVSAKNNKQLALYALGVYFHFDLVYGFDTIIVTIHQPRLDSVTTEHLNRASLLLWAEFTLKPKAQEAWEGKGELVPGPHCKFCKVAPQCRALADANLALTAKEFMLLTPSETAEILTQLDRVKSWAKSLETFALAAALTGKHWPGFKVVEGRSQRSWKLKEGLIALLRAQGYKEADIFEPVELLSVAKLEKVVPKADRMLLTPFVNKGRGKPALVSDTDKRPEFSSAGFDFADYAEAEEADEED